MSPVLSTVYRLEVQPGLGLTLAMDVDGNLKLLSNGQFALHLHDFDNLEAFVDHIKQRIMIMTSYPIWRPKLWEIVSPYIAQDVTE
jgi:hypothetical protein